MEAAMRSGCGFAVLAVVMVGLAFIGGCKGNELKAQNESLQARLQDLEFRNKDLETRLVTAETENSSLKNSLALSEQKVRSLQESGPKIIEKEGKLVMELSGEVFFGSGKASLKAEGKAQLKEVAKLLNTQYKDDAVRIAGHTDNQPIKMTKKLYKSNWELGASRALAVLHFLVDECALSPKRVHAATFGEYYPLESNGTARGRNKNRRVEILIMPGVDVKR